MSIVLDWILPLSEHVREYLPIILLLLNWNLLTVLTPLFEVPFLYAVPDLPKRLPVKAAKLHLPIDLLGHLLRELHGPDVPALPAPLPNLHLPLLLPKMHQLLRAAIHLLPPLLPPGLLQPNLHLPALFLSLYDLPQHLH